MSHESLSNPPSNIPLLEKFIYQDPDMSFKAIAAHTSDIFQAYFKNGKRLTAEEHDYLNDRTIPFIDSVRAGLAAFPQMVDRLRMARFEDYERLLMFDAPSVLPVDEVHEALDVSLITMGMMPDAAVKLFRHLEGHSVPLEFSKRGMLRYPDTLDQTRERIDELKKNTLNVDKAKVPRSLNFLAHPELARTAIFFDVGRNFPMRTEQMQRNVEVYLTTDPPPASEDEQLAWATLAEKFKNPLDR